MRYYIRLGMVAAAILYAASQVPVLIEIRSDLTELRENLKIAEQGVRRIEDGLFFIAANAPSSNQRQVVQDLENILERKSTYSPQHLELEGYHIIELTITYP